MKELSLLNTQKAIKDCKDMFIGALSQELDLSRVSARSEEHTSELQSQR